MRARLNLAFKGNRDYVQGPDICKAIVEALPLQGEVPFRISIHHFARRECDVVVGAGSPANAVARFWSRRGADAIEGWVEEVDSSITRRAPYDEEPIWSRSERSGSEIRLTSAVPGNYSAVEVLVSLTKRLHLEALDQSSVKWVFTQLDISRLLTAHDVEQLGVRIDQALGVRFTKSSIYCGTERLGAIHFAGVAQS